MMEIQPQSLKNGKSSRSILIWSVIAVVSAIGNLLFLWITSLRLAENVTMFYWQRFEIYYFCLRCLTFVATLIAIWFIAGIKSGVWAFVTATIVTIGYFLIFGFINYTSLFITNIITNVGTVELKSNIYQLATVDQADEYTQYYLGRCDRTGYICKFRDIYSTSSLQVLAPPEISLSDDSQMLIIKINKEVVYTYDGNQERCIDRDNLNSNDDFGSCVNNTNSP
jgi:hypothetical protein